MSTIRLHYLRWSTTIRVTLTITTKVVTSVTSEAAAVTKGTNFTLVLKMKC